MKIFPQSRSWGRRRYICLGIILLIATVAMYLRLAKVEGEWSVAVQVFSLPAMGFVGMVANSGNRLSEEPPQQRTDG
jgi:hypothetical protein